MRRTVLRNAAAQQQLCWHRTCPVRQQGHGLGLNAMLDVQSTIEDARLARALACDAADEARRVMMHANRVLAGSRMGRSRRAVDDEGSVGYEQLLLDRVEDC